METTKAIENLVYAYLTEGSISLTSEDKVSLLSQGYVELDLKTPTTKGIEHYLNKFKVDKISLPLTTQIALDAEFKGAVDVNVLFSKILQLLSKAKNCAAFVVTLDGSFFVSGLSNLLDSEYFCELNVIKKALGLLDDPARLLSLLENEFSLNPLNVKFGEKLDKDLKNAVLMSRYFFVGGSFMKSGYFGILTAKNTNYELLMPYLEYIGKTLEDKLPIKQDPIEVMEESVQPEEAEDAIQTYLPLKQRKSILLALTNRFKNKNLAD